jgi:hypothetical protein
MNHHEGQIELPHEIVVDEDVLSYAARAALEQVGSATGFILAFALLFALMPRARRFLALGAGAARAISETRSASESGRRVLGDGDEGLGHG